MSRRLPLGSDDHCHSLIANCEEQPTVDMPLEAIPQLPPEDVERILRYLDLPPSTTLPSPPLVFLSEHIHTLPPPLLAPLGSITTSRQRSSIPLIKSRRWLYASTSPPPPPLRADAGRLRWPLLWERLGGSSLPPPSSAVEEEESWVAENFLPGKEGRQHVKKLGGFLRGLEEEREAEGVREARRAERRLDDVGEEFDESSDEEDDEKGKVRVAGLEEDQDEVKRVFERRLLEIFVDGLDVRYTLLGEGRG